MKYMTECGCGVIFEASRKSKYGRCPKCVQRAARISHQKWLEKEKVRISPLSAAVGRGVARLVVLKDPLDCGGFSPGMTFAREEWMLMLEHLTFTPGTVLRDSQMRKYEFQLGEGV